MGVNYEYINPFDEKYNYLMRIEHLGRYYFAADLFKNYKNILDVACADGYGTKILSQNVVNVIGVDRNDKYLNIAKTKYNNDNIEYECIDLNSDTINGLYDGIVCFETLEHLKYPDNFLKNLYNILNENGIILLSIPNLEYEKQENGNFVGSSVIYGYRKKPEDIHKLIVDDEAADVVREIFNMFLLGMTKSEIAEELNKREVMTPALYKKTHNLGYTKPKKDNKWNYEIIDRILRDENYTGTLVQGKRRNENYISHKEVKNPEEDWIKFENHHAELVSKEVFDKVQEMIKVQRRSTNKNDLLSGYLFCADCNGPMALVKGKKNSYYYCRNSLNKKNVQNIELDKMIYIIKLLSY